MTASAAKFDATRAGEYAEQSRIALAGYDACHELAACLLSADLGESLDRRILVVGAGGTAQEILVAGKLRPSWRFLAVDPSPPMLAGAIASVEAAGLSHLTTWHSGYVDELPVDNRFDAVTVIGVLHHLRGREAKLALLRAVAARLHPGGTLILACNRGAYAENLLFLKAWGERWRMAGASPEEVEVKRGKILQGADPPGSDAAVESLLAETGFEQPRLFFSSLFWGSWIARRSA
ncbi:MULTISPECIES: class I SAM-dependent methyltransferase [Roseixanthobacter]|jgi:tRNA (cmo5U34)-methyltransferase|nr:class I SAM-dependent methyltransferase [uncultured Bradyrhizobium sp.]RTM08445.1 MAG: class I SAM-dependent methyltransferase [Hyphomicrobiales bacterium]